MILVEFDYVYICVHILSYYKKIDMKNLSNFYVIVCLRIFVIKHVYFKHF